MAAPLLAFPEPGSAYARHGEGLLEEPGTGPSAGPRPGHRCSLHRYERHHPGSVAAMLSARPMVYRLCLRGHAAKCGRGEGATYAQWRAQVGALRANVAAPAELLHLTNHKLRNSSAHLGGRRMSRRMDRHSVGPDTEASLPRERERPSLGQDAAAISPCAATPRPTQARAPAHTTRCCRCCARRSSSRWRRRAGRRRCGRARPTARASRCACSTSSGATRPRPSTSTTSTATKGAAAVPHGSTGRKLWRWRGRAWIFHGPWASRPAVMTAVGAGAPGRDKRLRSVTK